MNDPHSPGGAEHESSRSFAARSLVACGVPHCRVGRGDGIERFRWHSLLNDREQPAFLEPDMLSEQRAELAQPRLEGLAVISLDAPHEDSKSGVIGARPFYEVVFGQSFQRWKEDLFFDLEVGFQLSIESAQDSAQVSCMDFCPWPSLALVARRASTSAW